MSEGANIKKTPSACREFFFARALFFIIYRYFLLFTEINIPHIDSYQTNYNHVEVCSANALLLFLFTPWCYK